MNKESLKEQVSSLFELGERGIFTSAAGYSHALYEQKTELSQHINKQMLRILDLCEVEYFLFAGSMVGYVRNKKMPFWMDDLDVIILEEHVQKFEETALPLLKESGFNCFYQEPLKGGGYHFLGMQQGSSRKLSIPLTEDKRVTVPWSQIDAFYTTTDEDGFIRNPKKWGLYHSKDIPIDWVKPGQFVEFEGIRAKVFSKFEEDILKEYGDVMNNVIIHSHDTTFLKLLGIPWAEFEAAFVAYLEETSTTLPANVTQSDLDDYRPNEEETYQTKDDESLSSICAGVLKSKAGTVHLTDGEQNFWAMDLKRLMPGLQVHVTVQTPLHAQRAAHLRAFIDAVDCASDDVKSEYEKCIAGLKRALNEA